MNTHIIQLKNSVQFYFWPAKIWQSLANFTVGLEDSNTLEFYCTVIQFHLILLII